MNDTPSPVPPPVPPAPPERPRNPLTHRQHRRESLRQITLPLATGVIVLLALCALTVVGSAAPDQHTRWAGISLVWLIVPTLFFALILLILLAGVIYLVTLLYQRLPAFARQVQDFFLMIQYQAAHLQEKLVEPILRARSAKASANTLARRLTKKFRKDTL